MKVVKRIYKNLSIRKKLILIISSVSIFTVILGLGIYSYLDIINFKEEMSINASLNAKLVSEYCVVPLTFEYNEEAQKILLKLETLPDVLNACIYDKNDEIFASFNRSGEVAFAFPKNPGSNSGFSNGYLHIFQPITFQDQNYGTTYFRISTSVINKKITYNLIILFVLILVLVFPVFLIAARLQRNISVPLVKLADATKEISEKTDYSVRVKTSGKDEIGVLYNQFNNMFEQIQRREIARNKAVEALRESEKKFKTVFESSSDSIILFDENGILDFNETTLKIFGCATRKEFGSNQYNELSPPFQPNGKESIQTTNEYIDMALHDGFIFFEWTYRRFNGEEFPAEVFFTPVEIDGRRVIQTTIRDITSRKEAEREINFLAHAIRSITECISITDLNNDIIFINDAFLKTYGYKKNELIGKNIDIVRKEINTEEKLNQINVSSLKNGWQGELINKRKDGTEFPIFLSTSSVCDENNKPIALVGVATDITERKQAMEELRKHREHLEILVKERTAELAAAIDATEKINRELIKSDRTLKESQTIAHLGQWELNIEKGRLNWSDEVSDIFKINNEKHGLSYKTFLNTVHPEDRNIVNRTYFTSIKNKENFDIIHRILLPDGQTKFVRNMGRSEYDNGNILKYIGTVQDVTEIKKAEEELRNANIQLQELDKLKSMFIASMSHELRTPLNSIIGFTGLMLQGISGDLNDKQKNNLNRVYNSGKHLLNLITDVIDISKIEAGYVSVFPEEFSLHKLVVEAAESIRPQLAQKKMSMEIKSKTWPVLHTDRKRLLQCLLNFLSNAVKYSEQGKVTISVQDFESQAEIHVKDTGIGIAEEDLPNVFKAFERFESKLKIRAGGTGLGLYLTKKIASEILQGKVSVESTLGLGSTFSIFIPKDISNNKNKEKEFQA